MAGVADQDFNSTEPRRRLRDQRLYLALVSDVGNEGREAIAVLPLQLEPGFLEDAGVDVVRHYPSVGQREARHDAPADSGPATRHEGGSVVKPQELPLPWIPPGLGGP